MGHGVEFGDGEPDRAVAFEAQHAAVGIGDLCAEAEPEPHADRAEKAVGDVAAAALLPDHLVQPMIGLRAVADNDRILGDALDDGRGRLDRMDRRLGLLHGFVELRKPLAPGVADGADEVAPVGPFHLPGGGVESLQHLAGIGDDRHGRVTQQPDFLGIDFDMNEFRRVRHETLGAAKREKAEAHAEGQHGIRLGVELPEVIHLVERAAIARVAARQHSMGLEVGEDGDAGRFDKGLQFLDAARAPGSRAEHDRRAFG